MRAHSESKSFGSTPQLSPKKKPAKKGPGAAAAIAMADGDWGDKCEQLEVRLPPFGPCPVAPAPS